MRKSKLEMALSQAFRPKSSSPKDAPVLSDELIKAKALQEKYPVSAEQRAIPIPDARRRFLVSGKRLRDYPQIFLPAGKRAHGLILDSLSSSGIELSSNSNILDWGCGCGRITRHWLGTGHNVFGIDIDAEAIDWCKSNLQFANFQTCGLKPPTDFADKMFDLVTATSVITHLGLSEQVKWMEELWRIVKPGGTVLVTHQGPHSMTKAHRYSFVSHLLFDNEQFCEANDHGIMGQNPYFTGQTRNAVATIFYPFEMTYSLPLQQIMGGQDTVVLRKPVDAKLIPGSSSADSLTLSNEESIELSSPEGCKSCRLCGIVKLSSGDGAYSLSLKKEIDSDNESETLLDVIGTYKGCYWSFNHPVEHSNSRMKLTAEVKDLDGKRCGQLEICKLCFVHDF